MAVQKTMNIVATMGSYTNNQGQEKKRYLTVGTLFIFDDGGMSIKIDAVPTNFDGKLSVYEKDNQQNNGNTNQASQQNNQQQQGGYQQQQQQQQHQQQQQGQQRQAYQAPQATYQDAQGNPQSQQAYQRNQQKVMPSTQQIGIIDGDIPF